MMTFHPHPSAYRLELLGGQLFRALFADQTRFPKVVPLLYSLAIAEPGLDLALRLQTSTDRCTIA